MASSLVLLGLLVLLRLAGQLKLKCIKFVPHVSIASQL